MLAIEGRIQMPNVTGAAASGYWPAFWALGAPYRGNYQNWPGIGEFDVMENVNGINSVWGVLHCGVAPGGPCNESNGLGASRACPGASCQSAFHTYRFEWDASISPQQLRWYVDGQLYHTVTQSQVGASAWSQMTSHAGYFLLLNVAMGGAFPNGVAGSGTPTAATIPGSTDAGRLRGRVPPRWRDQPRRRPPRRRAARGTRTRRSRPSRSTARTVCCVEACAEGGQNIGALRNGDWARYDNVEFGSARASRLRGPGRLRRGDGVSGLVEVRVDSPTAAPIGSFAIGNTGGWQSWRSVPGNVGAVTGPAHRLSHLHQRPTERLRQRQLVHLPPLRRTLCGLPSRRPRDGRSAHPGSLWTETVNCLNN